MNKPIEKHIKIIRGGKKYIIHESDMNLFKSEMIVATYKGITYVATSIYKIGVLAIVHLCSSKDKINVQAELIEFLDHCKLCDTVIKKVKK